MSYPIVLCVVVVEALNLALLWIALRVSMSRMLRPLVAGAGLSGAWGAWVLVLVLRDPPWSLALTCFVFALSSVVMGIAIHVATVEEEDRREEGGSAVPSVNPETPSGSGDDEPVWWPEFQREVATYAAQRESERQPVDC